jgi:hypothetical protein
MQTFQMDLSSTGLLALQTDRGCFGLQVVRHSVSPTITPTGRARARAFNSFVGIQTHCRYISQKRLQSVALWLSCLSHTHHNQLTVSVDLYGRGYSDCPPPPYTAERYITQLALLMQKVGWDKADIAGLSMVRYVGLTKSAD